MTSDILTILVALFIVDAMLTAINIAILMVVVKLYTEILKIRELTRQ